MNSSNTLNILVVLLIFSCVTLAQDFCKEEFGESATCGDISECSTGFTAGLCPGEENVQCCLNFDLKNAFLYYDNENNPHQLKAFNHLEAVLQYYLEYRKYSCMYRNQTYDENDPSFCGTGDMISLSNSAIYFKELAHQAEAAQYLQQTLLKEGLFDDYKKFVQEFRNIGAFKSDSFLPNPPSTSNSLGSCSSPINGFSGHCIPQSDCTGATFNYQCSGGSNILCCSGETKSASFSKEHIDLSTFRSLFSGISYTRAEAFHPYFNEALDQILGGTSSQNCHRIAAFAAQIGHESVGLLYFEEIATGSDYEWRDDLGNVRAGDGRRYKGRGPIQLTGRANYRSASYDLGTNWEAVPEAVSFPSAGFLAATWFWNSRNLNRYATGNWNDFTTLSVRINGGKNGITDRRNRWATAKSLLRCDSPGGSANFQLMGVSANNSDIDDLTNLIRDFCSQKYTTEEEIEYQKEVCSLSQKNQEINHLSTSSFNMVNWVLQLIMFYSLLN